MNHPVETLCQRAPAMGAAAQTVLRADRAYLDLLEAESTWAYKYNLNRPNPLAPRAFPIHGLNAPAPGPLQVDLTSELRPEHFRVRSRAAQNRPRTELYGTAPYTAVGRGVMNYVDTSTLLLQGTAVNDRSRRISEREWDRSEFVTVPRDLQKLDGASLRLGEMTRVGPAYLQPHQ